MTSRCPTITRPISSIILWRAFAIFATCSETSKVFTPLGKTRRPMTGAAYPTIYRPRVLLGGSSLNGALVSSVYVFLEQPFSWLVLFSWELLSSVQLFS